MADFIEDEIRNTLIELGTEFAESTIQDLVKELVEQKKIATGALKSSFDFNLKGGIENFVIELLAENYVQYVNDGRRPGKWAPVKAIEDWCKVKGIDKKFSYPINLKIKTVGIKPTKFFDKVLSDKRIDSYTNKLEDVLGGKIDAILDTIFYNSEFKTNKP
jgi:hypothetical protein